MTKYLIDTCIWRDFYEYRYSKNGRALGKSASELFIKILKNKNLIIYSDYLIRELKKDYNENSIKDMLNIFYLNEILIRINTSDDEIFEAKLVSKIRCLPVIDCLYAIQARNHDAILVSQDKHILKNLSDISRVSRP